MYMVVVSLTFWAITPLFLQGFLSPPSNELWTTPAWRCGRYRRPLATWAVTSKGPGPSWTGPVKRKKNQQHGTNTMMTIGYHRIFHGDLILSIYPWSIWNNHIVEKSGYNGNIRLYLHTWTIWNQHVIFEFLRTLDLQLLLILQATSAGLESVPLVTSYHPKYLDSSRVQTYSISHPNHPISVGKHLF